jgi:hypothetical protein
MATPSRLTLGAENAESELPLLRGAERCLNLRQGRLAPPQRSTVGSFVAGRSWLRPAMYPRKFRKKVLRKQYADGELDVEALQPPTH